MNTSFSQPLVAAIVLAAGKAERMGQAKVLLEWTEGTTILSHILQQLQLSGVIDQILVITGAYGPMVTDIAQQAGALPIANPDYDVHDMLSSLKVGLRYLMPQSQIGAALVVLGDQPQIEVSTLQAVIRAYRDGQGTIIVPTFNRQRGHPVLFDRLHWEALCDLPAEAAPRAVLSAHPEHVFEIEVSTDSILQDIDTPADYASARKRAGLASLQ